MAMRWIRKAFGGLLMLVPLSAFAVATAQSQGVRETVLGMVITGIFFACLVYGWKLIRS